MLDELMAIGNRDVREEDETMSLDTVPPSPSIALQHQQQPVNFVQPPLAVDPV